MSKNKKVIGIRHTLSFTDVRHHSPLDGYLIHSGVYTRVTRNFQPILYVETYTDFALCLSTSRR